MKENLNKFQNKTVNLFIKGVLDFKLLSLTSSDLAFQTFPGRAVFFFSEINPPNLKQQGVNYFSTTRCMQSE